MVSFPRGESKLADPAILILHDPESAEASFTIRSGLASIGQNEKRFARLKMRIAVADRRQLIYSVFHARVPLLWDCRRELA
jgi:hypothetical protein